MIPIHVHADSSRGGIEHSDYVVPLAIRIIVAANEGRGVYAGVAISPRYIESKAPYTPEIVLIARVVWVVETASIINAIQVE